ncbi:hypothetical protein [uncultured Arthrobacter sp.]|uniref:DoxX family protein n=1 Tax=uncultured Arthrobacter sp. TaxID=114050 RepID=UPI00262B4B51|nr:hypothetical protein [uncultured Arthrobacter sp.]
MSSSTASQRLVRIGLGAFMTFAGTSHLTFAREPFQAQVPVWIPLDKDLVVLASGVVEVGLGVAFLALPRHRRVVGVALAGFYTAIFPGNINQYVQRLDAFNLDSDGKRLGRLFFQPVLIAGALWGGGLPVRH